MQHRKIDTQAQNMVSIHVPKEGHPSPCNGSKNGNSDPVDLNQLDENGDPLPSFFFERVSTHVPKERRHKDILSQTLVNHVVTNGSSPDRYTTATNKTLPWVLLPRTGRSDSRFAREINEELPKELLFVKDRRVVEVINGLQVKTANPIDKTPRGLRFDAMTPLRLKTWIEAFITTGVMAKTGKKDDAGELIKDERGNPEAEFREKTMSNIDAGTLLECPSFIKGQYRISRILDVPIPVLMPGGEIFYPQPGYNKDLEIYCDPAAPVVQELSLDRALEVIKEVYVGFCFKANDNDQSKTHAIARLVTPYVRGVIGFPERTPFWYYEANRPGAGKDYCNGVTQIVYQGAAFEDMPLGKNSEETGKRILTALVAGRRSMHFANCQGHLDDEKFIHAQTAPKICGRMLGSTDAKSDLELPNEIEFSISANLGMTCREDVERRCRRITLEYFEEGENERVFARPDLHGWVLENRGLILSAVHTLFKLWWDATGGKSGSTFTSYPKWARVVGGLMLYHGLGNPTLPHKAGLIGGDLRTRAMTALYELALPVRADGRLTKFAIRELITRNQEDDDRLAWFGDLSERDHQTQLGMSLTAFQGRVLSGIEMKIDTSSANSSRHIVLFAKA